MPDFYWDDLTDSLVLRAGNVVPIVGSELLDLPGESPDAQAVPLSGRLAAECAPLLAAELSRLAIPLSVPAGASLEEQRNLARAAHALSPEFIRAGGFPRLVKEAHDRLLSMLLPDGLPEPLRLLVEMQEAFPFIVCTSTDDLLARALGLGRSEVRAAMLGSCVDLDAGWQPGDKPRLFHLFGRIDSGADTVLSDEDRLEYLAHLHYKGRPDRLLSHLRMSHLLFLGQRFPDYLALVFLRFVRGERFAGEGKQALEAIVDSEIQAGAPLVGFLRRYSARTRIFEEGGSAAFVREMHRRWREALVKEATPAPAGEIEPADMPRPAIFLSYASENHGAVEALATALRVKHLPVWLDRWQLEGGDRFASKIERHIRHCRLFVPVLSRDAASRQRGWFRREWDLAHLLLRDLGPELTWVIPVAVDDLDPYGSRDIEEYFTVRGKVPQVLRCLGGKPSDQDLDLFIRKFKAAELAAKSA
jgi:hypothetical protein